MPRQGHRIRTRPFPCLKILVKNHFICSMYFHREDWCSTIFKVKKEMVLKFSLFQPTSVLHNGVILSISLEYDFHINSTTGLTTDSASGINRKERQKRVFPLKKQNQIQTALSQTTHVTLEPKSIGQLPFTGFAMPPQSACWPVILPHPTPPNPTPLHPSMSMVTVTFEVTLRMYLAVYKQ